MRKLLSRKSIIAAALCAPPVALVVLFFVARGAKAEGTTATTSAAAGATAAEPTITAPTTPTRGNETPMRDPFAPFDNGPVEGRWDYAMLRLTEQQDIDRERTNNARANWTSTHDGFRSALAEQAKAAASTAAARQLGIDNLATLGVVP
jgi:hypothetical protein